MQADGSGGQDVARGTRNSAGFDWQPGSGRFGAPKPLLPGGSVLVSDDRAGAGRRIACRRRWAVVRAASRPM